MVNEIEAISWYDACSNAYDAEMLEVVKRLESGMELLPINTTYGKVHCVLKDIIIIITESTPGATSDVVLVPRAWIKTPRKYKCE